MVDEISELISTRVLNRLLPSLRKMLLLWTWPCFSGTQPIVMSQRAPVSFTATRSIDRSTISKFPSRGPVYIPVRSREYQRPRVGFVLPPPWWPKGVVHPLTWPHLWRLQPQLLLQLHMTPTPGRGGKGSNEIPPYCTVVDFAVTCTLLEYLFQTTFYLSPNICTQISVFPFLTLGKQWPLLLYWYKFCLK